MKLFFAIALAACTFSCRKAGLPLNVVLASDTAGGTFAAVINGKQWTAMDSARSVTIMNGAINLSGLSRDGQAIVLSLAGVSPGTYSLGPNSNSRVIWWDSVTFMQNFSTEQGSRGQAGGQVVVTDIDQAHQTISGNFHCSVYSDSAGYGLTVTNGVFSRLPYISSYPVSPQTDTFTVQINGVQWSAPSITANNVEGAFLVQGSSTDGRQIVDLQMPLPAWNPIYVIPRTLYLANDTVFVDQTFYGPNTYLFNQEYLQVTQNDLVNRRLSATFSASLNDSAGTRQVQLANGYFSLRY